MTFEIQMQIDNQSPEGRALEAIMTRDRVSPEGAIRLLLAQLGTTTSDAIIDLFTPEVVADLRSIAADIEAGGRSYSMDEVDDNFVEKRESWLANHPS
jgi:hypothetical protein